jgi:uncharacterized protein
VCPITHYTTADFAGAKQYALQRLERDLPSNLTYHSIAHTRDNVVPATEQLATLEGVSEENAMLLSTAAWFHDLGYIERHTDNEVIAVRIAGEVLPSLGYNAAQLQTICDIIMATHLPHTPQNQLEAIMEDADLDTLGREDFMTKVHALRAEFASFGTAYTDEEWYTIQRDFMTQHRYFTASAQKLRDAQKVKNIAVIKALLDESRNHSE